MEPSASQSTSRRSYTRARDVYACVLLGILAAAGCSVVNSFGDVKTTPAGNDTGPTTDSGSPGDTPTSEDGAPAPPKGLIVVGGVSNADGGTQQVLSVLDPETGKEFTRELMTVSAVLYDGDRDWWYIWENTASGHFQPLPGDKVTLHVRQWKNGAWDSTTSKDYPNFPTPLGQETTVMTSAEPVYLAYKPGWTTPTFTCPPGACIIAALDANNVADVALITAPPKDFTGAPLAAIGSRSNTGKTGGNFDVLERDSCDDAGTTCNLVFNHWSIPNSFDAPTPVGPITVVSSTPGPSVASPGYGLFATNTEDLVSLVLPTDTKATLYRVNPLAGGQTTVKFDFSGSNRQFKPIAVDECEQIAFVPELLSTTIYFVPLISTVKAGVTQNAGHPAQRVVWEPFTHKLLAPFNQGGGFEITAFNVTVRSDGTPLSDRLPPGSSTWDVPKDLGPQITVTKTPTDKSVYCGVK